MHYKNALVRKGIMTEGEIRGKGQYYTLETTF